MRRVGYRSAMASLFNPAGLVDLAEQTVRAYIKTASWGERQVFGLIRSGMHLSTVAVPALPQSEAEIEERSDDDVDSLDAKMHGLLDRAVGQNTASSRQELFHKIFHQILADGATSPLLNVYARTRAGLGVEVVLENMSLIGKTANLALPQLTPMYVSHLLSLGLVESGPEDSDMKDEYEILAADTAVLQAIKTASRGPIPARIEKYTLQLSGLGLELWAAASVPREREGRRRSSRVG